MAEWLKAHAWKACVGETLPWVRIPLSPPHSPLANVAGERGLQASVRSPSARARKLESHSRPPRFARPDGQSRIQAAALAAGSVLQLESPRRATVVTTNLAFAEWVTVFAGDEMLTTALLARLAHHATGDHHHRQELSHEEATQPRRLTRPTRPSRRGEEAGLRPRPAYKEAPSDGSFSERPTGLLSERRPHPTARAPDLDRRICQIFNRRLTPWTCGAAGLAPQLAARRRKSGACVTGWLVTTHNPRGERVVAPAAELTAQGRERSLSLQP